MGVLRPLEQSRVRALRHVDDRRARAVGDPLGRLEGGACGRARPEADQREVGIGLGEPVQRWRPRLGGVEDRVPQAAHQGAQGFARVGVRVDDQHADPRCRRAPLRSLLGHVGSASNGPGTTAVGKPRYQPTWVENRTPRPGPDSAFLGTIREQRRRPDPTVRCRDHRCWNARAGPTRSMALQMTCYQIVASFRRRHHVVAATVAACNGSPAAGGHRIAASHSRPGGCEPALAGLSRSAMDAAFCNTPDPPLLPGSPPEGRAVE